MSEEHQIEVSPPDHQRDSVEAEREALERHEAQELARAQAEQLLDGPGLRPPAPPIPAPELESLWSPEARRALHGLRDDLEGHRVGLAISGGGSLGSFEAGCLRFLYDHTAVAPVAICGNSAGALNAAKLAEGEPTSARTETVNPPTPTPFQRPIDEVERIWRALRINSDMWEPEPWLVRLQASASWAAALRDQVSDSDSAASAVRVAVRVVGSLVRRPPETDGTIEAIRESLRAQSLLSLDPIAALVDRELQPEKVKASGIELRMGTVSLEAGELRYVTQTGEMVDRHNQPVDQPPVNLADGVLASASIPLAFPPVDLNGEHYVDGGAREILPLELLVERMGVDRVVAVVASSASIKRAPSFEDRNLLDILRRVSAEIGPNETLRKELNPPGGWRPEVRLVVPQFNVHDSMTIDPALIAISFDYGYLRGADVLLRLGHDADHLTEQITRLRVRIRELAAPLPSILDTAFGKARPAASEPRSRGRGGGAEKLVNGVEPAELDQPEDNATTGDPDEGRPDPSDESVAARAAESVVRSAKALTASSLARLEAFMSREEEALHLTSSPDPATSNPDQGEPEVDGPLTDGSLTDGPPAPVAPPTPDLGPVTPAEAVDHVAARPLADAQAEAERAAAHEAHLAAEAQAAENAREILRLTAELRDLVERRLDLGYPLPPSLVGWLRAER